jgi:hypothetical protein
MCKFESTVGEERIRCRYSELGVLKTGMPIDDEGYCILHSKNIQWKEENGFNECLKNAIIYYQNKPDNKLIVLENVAFTETANEVFKDAKFEQEVSFKGSIFMGKVDFKNMVFDKGVSFKSASFENYVEFENITSVRFEFDNAVFRRDLLVNNCVCTSNFSMTGVHLDGGLRIWNTTFHQCAFFEKMVISKDENGGGCFFNKVTFKDYATFELSQFNGNLLFDEVLIEDTFVFEKVDFTYHIATPIYSSVYFKKVTISKSGRLEFRGTPDNKIFSKVYDVDFIDETLEGEVFFENTDFTKVGSFSKDRLIGLSKGEGAKVVIGSGCLKYLNQTPIKTIQVTKDNQNLVSELCSTFVEFFTKNTGCNLGVEIVSRNESEIRLFYFSDENLSYEKFESLLQKSEIEMWSLVKISKQSITSEKDNSGLSTRIINSTDTIINLLGTVLKIATRIPFGKISYEEVNSLLVATNFTPQLPMNPESLKSININQTILLGIGNTQTLKI